MLVTSLVQSASLGLAILFPRLVNGQSTTEFTRSDAPPPELYLRRGAARVTVLGDYLYIDGGEVSQLDLEGNPIKNRDSNAVNSTLSIDLSKSWTASNVSIRVIEKAAPKMDGQVIWKHEGMKTFFIWGGHKPYGGKVDALESWKFEADGQGGGEWVTETSANPTFYSELRRTEEGAYVSTPDAGFVFGGIATGWTNANPASQPVPGVLSYNMTTKMWTNETTPGFSGFSKHGTMVGGGAVYIPTFGDNGLIVVMGGSTWTLQPSQSTPDGWMDFGNLTFYDPISKNWYWQQTTGTAPTARRGLCYVGVEGQNGTYEIFVFGGTNSDTGSSFDDVYVLSLPGFVWTQVPYESKITRRSHSCAVVGRRQMLSVGGTDGKTGWSGQDMWPQGLGVFDMTEWYWKDTYDAEAKDYETSKTIQEWYEKGGVDEIKWSSDRVQKRFVNSTATINPTGVSDGPTSTPKAEVSSGEPSRTTISTAVIVGVVVGVVVGIIAVIAAFWYLRKRKQRQADASPILVKDEEGSRSLRTGASSTYYEAVSPGELQAISPKPELYGGATPRLQEWTGSSKAEVAGTDGHHFTVTELDAQSQQHEGLLRR